MPSSLEPVTRPVRDPRTPDQIAPGVALLHRLVQDRMLDRLRAAFTFGRRGGFTGQPIAGFLLVYLTCGLGWGIRPFWETFRVPLRRVAAVAECRRFPSSASMSRALGRMNMKFAERFTDSVLTEIPGLTDLLRHLEAAHIDRRGAAWRVLDGDPHVNPFEQRGLVEGDEYPEPERLAPGVPGYVGQKRGSLRTRNAPICHAGTGLWLVHELWDDNPHLSVKTAKLVERGVFVMEKAGVQRGWCVFRGDGEFGSVGGKPLPTPSSPTNRTPPTDAARPGRSVTRDGTATALFASCTEPHQDEQAPKNTSIAEVAWDEWEETDRVVRVDLCELCALCAKTGG